VYGRPRWLPPNESPPLLDVSAEELGLVRRILDEIARAEDLLTTDAEFAAADGSGGQRVFEERRAHHLRFRPVDRASGTPVKDPPRSVDDDLERETRRTLLAARVRRRLDVEIGPRWAVRATPAIVSIDVFPATHHKGLARDHLLAGDGIGGRRQLVSFGDRLDGNDAPLVETPLPGAEDRYAFLSVAKRPPELQRRLDSGRLDPRILVAHVGEGCGSTIALLNRVLRLRSKGLAAKDALTRALREVQDAMFWRRNADVAEQIARRWAADQPLTLAFDIDGTINVQDGQPVHADIPPIMKELDSWGFQLAVITGKKLDRVRRENLLGIAEVIDAAPEEQS
jgi:hydroxymethylpyrimidine pyrophosphatase-like HAD family hydrolase